MAENWEVTREVTQGSSSIPLHSCWWPRAWRKGGALWGAYNSQRKTLCLSHISTNSGSSGALLQPTTTTTAQLKVIQSHCTVLKDTTEMSLLMDNCILVYTTAGRLVGCIAHILSMHCQMIYKKRLEKKFWQVNNSTPWVLSQKLSYNRAISKGRKNLVFFPEEV